MEASLRSTKRGGSSRVDGHGAVGAATDWHTLEERKADGNELGARAGLQRGLKYAKRGPALGDVPDGRVNPFQLRRRACSQRLPGGTPAHCIGAVERGRCHP